MAVEIAKMFSEHAKTMVGQVFEASLARDEESGDGDGSSAPRGRRHLVLGACAAFLLDGLFTYVPYDVIKEHVSIPYAMGTPDPKCAKFTRDLLRAAKALAIREQPSVIAAPVQTGGASNGSQSSSLPGQDPTTGFTSSMSSTAPEVRAVMSSFLGGMPSTEIIADEEAKAQLGGSANGSVGSAVCEEKKGEK